MRSSARVWRKRPPSGLSGTVEAARLLLTSGLGADPLCLMLGASVFAGDARVRYVPGTSTSGLPWVISTMEVRCHSFLRNGLNWKLLDAEAFSSAALGLWHDLTYGDLRRNEHATNRSQLRRAARAVLIAEELLRVRAVGGEAVL
jgi:hypothetical protein